MRAKLTRAHTDNTSRPREHCPNSSSCGLNNAYMGRLGKTKPQLVSLVEFVDLLLDPVGCSLGRLLFDMPAYRINETIGHRVD